MQISTNILNVLKFWSSLRFWWTEFSKD